MFQMSRQMFEHPAGRLKHLAGRFITNIRPVVSNQIWSRKYLNYKTTSRDPLYAVCRFVFRIREIPYPFSMNENHDSNVERRSKIRSCKV